MYLDDVLLEVVGMLQTLLLVEASVQGRGVRFEDGE
jgi:hypothetical protein